MSLRVLAAAALLAFAPPGLASLAMAPAFAQAGTATMSTQELMRAAALDDIFTQFGAGIAAAPDEQGIPFLGAQKTAWQQAAADVFAADGMHAELARMLDGKFDPEDLTAFADFYHSAFGQRVTELERAVALLPPESQTAARDEGLALAEATDARRSEQIDEMLTLVSADISSAMVRQSVRGMLIGMSLNGQQGDIQVPWEEVDRHLDAIMPAIEADLVLTQRAISYYAYQELSEAELEQYLDFLRTTPAQKLYALAAYSIGEIISTRMQTFGETIARRLAQVSV